jgi:hypothetical protein
MYIKQISIFLENSPGRLKAITRILAENDIDIRALSLSDTSDFGILRLITANPEKAVEVLKGKDCTVRLTDVLAIAMDDKPGSLAQVVDVLSDQGINIEYMYAFINRGSEKKAYVILRVEHNDKACNVLKTAGIDLLRPESIYNM